MPTPLVRTFPLSGPVNLLARIGHGSITVDTRDDLAEVTVEISARSAESDVLEHAVVELRGPTVVVRTPRQGGVFDLPLFGGRPSERDPLDVVVVVPTGTALKISTNDADVRVTGRCGGADIAAGSAAVALEHVDGDLRVRHGAGSIVVERVSGSVQSRSGSGDARFGEIGGDLVAACGSGHLEVGTARGSVRSRAGSGGATLSAVYGDVDVASGTGGVTIGVPAGVAARLELTTGSGGVQSELPIEDAPQAATRAIVVRARTGSGRVSLRRAA